jgi:hypothetical protein
MCCKELRSCKYGICLDTSYIFCVWRALGLTEHTMFAATWRGDWRWNGDTALMPGSAILTAHIFSFTRPTTELWHKNKDSHNPQRNWNITTHTNNITKLMYACRNITLMFPVTHNWFLVNVFKWSPQGSQYSSQYSSNGIKLCNRLENWENHGSKPGTRKWLLFSPQHPNGNKTFPPSLSTATSGVFPCRKVTKPWKSMTLTTHLHLVLVLRISAATLTLKHMQPH